MDNSKTVAARETSSMRIDALSDTAHNECMSLLACVEPTVRSLLVELAFADALAQDDRNWAAWDAIHAELEGLEAMTDLNRVQWNAIATAAYVLAGACHEMDVYR